MLLHSLIIALCLQVGLSQTFVRNYVGDPEAEMTAPQIIKYWGYPVEVHKTTTAGITY
jgi:hypothetical protein